MMQEKFWMIWRDGSLNTQFRHTSLESARKEAQRIACVSPGSVVYVLEVVGAFALHPMEIEITNDIPF